MYGGYVHVCDTYIHVTLLITSLHKCTHGWEQQVYAYAYAINKSATVYVISRVYHSRERTFNPYIIKNEPVKYTG